MPEICTLWCSIVQSHIDYCSHLWTLHRIGDNQKIESLFGSLSSKIYPISELNYWDGQQPSRCILRRGEWKDTELYTPGKF